MSVGLGFLASRSGLVVLAVGAAIRILRLIGREEAELEKQQGERFREFCRRVPRIFLSFRPRIPAAGLKPQWGQAFRGEAFMWGFFLTMVGFTITLQDRRRRDARRCHACSLVFRPRCRAERRRMSSHRVTAASRDHPEVLINSG